MEAAKTSGDAERSKQIIGFKDDEKHLPSEMTQRGQSSGTEDKIKLVEQPQTPAVSPSPGMESQVLALGNILTSKSREQCHIQLRRKNVPLPNKRYLQSEYELLSEGLLKKEQKLVKTGKYVCQYCGRACAKPSVLKKHIRSHTGERPYPCIPCGFSFKTKSNLYKHRKSHTHAVKAGWFHFQNKTASIWMRSWRSQKARCILMLSRAVTPMKKLWKTCPWIQQAISKKQRVLCKKRECIGKKGCHFICSNFTQKGKGVIRKSIFMAIPGNDGTCSYCSGGPNG